MSKKEVDIMIDFETLAVSRDAVLLSCGIITFNDAGDHGEDYTEFDIIPQIANGNVIHPSTIDWWRKTNEVEFLRLMQDGESSHNMWLSARMSDIQDEYKLRHVWSRGGLDFDILTKYVDIPYWKSRDCRTLDVFRKMESENTHDALEDCRNQVDHVQEVMDLWKTLEKKGKQS